MPGIFSLYTENAREYIQHRLHKPHTINRARFELVLFEQLAKSDLEVNYKIAWCHAFLNTTMFDHVWTPHISTLNLDPDQVTRYTANPDLFEYELPSTLTTHTPIPHTPNPLASTTTGDATPPSSPQSYASPSFASPNHRTITPTRGVLKDYVPEVTAIQKRQEKEDGAFRPNAGINTGGKGKGKGTRRGVRGGKKHGGGKGKGKTVGGGKVTGEGEQKAKGKGRKVSFSDPLEVEVRDREPAEGGSGIPEPVGEETEVEMEMEMEMGGDEAGGQLVFD